MSDESVSFTREEARELLKDVAVQGSTIKNVEQALVDISQSMRLISTLEERLANVQDGLAVFRKDLSSLRLELRNLEERFYNDLQARESALDTRLRKIEDIAPVAKLSGWTIREMLVKVISGVLLLVLGYLLNSMGAFS